MKRVTVVFALVFLFSSACKKTNSVAPSNTISANVDGVIENFNTNPFAQLGSGVALNSSLAIYGATGTASVDDVLTITINTNSAIGTGVYTSGSNSIGFVSIVYTGGGLITDSYNTDVTSNKTTVTITSLTSTNVQGTFSGTLINSITGTSKTVTNGKFNLIHK